MALRRISRRDAETHSLSLREAISLAQVDARLLFLVVIESSPKANDTAADGRKLGERRSSHRRADQMDRCDSFR